MRSCYSLLPVIAVVFALLILGYKYFYRPVIPAVTTKVTIVEGMTANDIDRLLSSQGIIEAGSIHQELEGYLFPDTYEFYVPHNTPAVLERFQDNFNKKVLPVIPRGKDLKETIIVASLIEKEAPHPADRRIISGILHKRLKADIPLQVDASICYLKAEANCLPITEADLKRDSPYNTYRYRGLPRGPIGNPGLDAIEAALYPEKSPYWFYLSDPKTKRAVFARDAEEHNRNVAQYLR